MKRSSNPALVLVALAVAGMADLTAPGTVARAQNAPAAIDSAAVADSVAAAAAAAAFARASLRAAWLSDRIPLRVGDLLTVLVDEQTAARERVSRVASGGRSQRGEFRAKVMDEDNPVSITSSLNNDSRDVGEAGREGDLTAVLSVRVTAIEPGGLVRISGSKQVNVDGRLQEVAVQGVIRPEDISAANTVLSSHIAETVITYKGKKIGPRTGIIGKILGLLWP